MAFIRFFLLLLAACVFSSSAQDGDKKQPIALNDLLAQGSIDPGTAAAISDRLRNELFNTGIFTVIERSQMQEILKEQGFQAAGACSSDACVVEMGQMLGVRFFIVGSIAKVGSTFAISSRMIDVQSGKIIQIANSDCRCEVDDVLLKSTVEIAKKMAKGASAHTGTQLPAGKKAGPAVESAPAAPKPEVIPAATEAGEKPAGKSRLGLRLGLGGGALACLTAGFIFNSGAQKKIDDALRNKNAYTTAPSNAEYTKYNTAYKSDISQARQQNLVRNIAYGLGGALAAGVALTWAF